MNSDDLLWRAVVLAALDGQWVPREQWVWTECGVARPPAHSPALWWTYAREDAGLRVVLSALRTVPEEAVRAAIDDAGVVAGVAAAAGRPTLAEDVAAAQRRVDASLKAGFAALG